MNKPLGIVVGLTALFSIASCGSGGNKATSRADSVVSDTNDDAIRKLGLPKIECDGTGEDFSGSYEFSAEEGKGECADNSDPAEMFPFSKKFSCIQKDGKFSCYATGQEKTPASGCIDRSGKFQLRAENDLGFLRTAAHISVSGAERIEHRSIIHGSFASSGGGEGEIIFASMAYRGKQKKGCLAKWQVEIKEVSTP